MNIVLIGMRGSGKTTVGRLLAERLGKRFIEMDEMITGKAGTSIAEIVARHGWPEFRKIEAEITSTVAGLDNTVNATGGGVVTSEANIRALRETGKLVWLRASLTTLLERTQHDPSRPSLTGKPPDEDMAVIFKERLPFYQQAADFTVDTDGATPEAVAETIINLLATGESCG
ncbi:MAG: shikimate kinase [Dehalococcoidales bacterium]|jgi:shikimate kinase